MLWVWEAENKLEEWLLLLLELFLLLACWDLTFECVG